jgi:hypothetical protein
MKSLPKMSYPLVAGLLGLALLAHAGCKREDKIEHYRVAKEEASARPKETAASQEPGRMLAALVPRGTQAWSFKVSGPVEAVGEKADAFRSFIKSITFNTPDGPPKWTLPEGWREQPGSQMRYATIQMGAGEKPLELSVMSVSWTDDNTAATLANVNRWRGQMSLKPITAQDLDKETSRVDLKDGVATIVDLEGTLSAGGGMGRPPFASGPVTPPVERPAAPSSKSGLTYTTPEGWKPGKATSMSRAAFEVVDGDERVAITVTDLHESAGALLPNINRWRQQLQLGLTTQEELDKAIQPIDVGGVKGQFIEILGPDGAKRQALLGAIVVEGGKAWFFKLMGDAPLAEREKSHFQSFVQSAKFN